MGAGDKRLTKLRQRLLLLYCTGLHPQMAVVGWSHYDGTGQEIYLTADQDAPPYETVIAAMQDGWRVIQFPVPTIHYPGSEDRPSHPGFFVLEKLEEV